MNSATSQASIRIGTRSSALARWQADWVAGQLRDLGHTIEIVHVTTRGDREQVQSIGAIGGDGLFTKELQRSLLANEIDLAVHSLKDLPTEPVEGLTLGAIPSRAPVGDVLVSHVAKTFEELPRQARVGTGSQRRRAQLLHQRPDLQMLDIRGNVDTRLRKLRDGEFDAIVLAEAGLMRLGLAAEITERLPTSLMLPAVGQGALGLECRASDQATRDAIASLNDADSHAAVLAERTMLRAVSGGCLAPVAAWGRVETAGELILSAVVLATDGSTRLAAERRGPCDEAEQLGRAVAEELLAQGAEALIRAARDDGRAN